MAVVKINAIEVPEGAGPELERRFGARHGAVEDDQLMAQREVLEHQGTAGPEREEEAREDQGQHAGHHR